MSEKTFNLWKAVISPLVIAVNQNLGNRKIYIKNLGGTSLVVQWLRLRVPSAGDPGLIPGQGTRSYMPQLKACMLQLRPGAAKINK